MNKIETEFLDVPMDFRIACEAFGIMVPDFLQLIIRHVSFANLFMHDDSEYDLATKAFVQSDDKITKAQPDLKGKQTLGEHGKTILPHIRSLVKLSMNRSYSKTMKREKGRKITDKLYRVCSPHIKHKPYLYLNEETKLTLTKDFLLVCLIHQFSPTVYINALMQCISLADLYARQHLDKLVYNAALGFYIRVQHGYGHLMDTDHINTLGFKDLILDLQEFDVRYFFIRDLEKRTAVYRARLEEVFEEKINQYYDGE
ncbi:hypothetical protein FXV77_07730 [Sphingobacterium phlebotomi]|uniref:Uncharacterized protein n=1 Tax=Sphingobacterium phlebotomi TaxID=2605433 RepID=A0A5D4H8Z8_9SPHI|nr:hypothetical protein [Sphingobacterium phlebotomi]TYR37054.1 hypothetical protein FXV77_07730 [Sphingobacterium phlebotomi]